MKYQLSLPPTNSLCIVRCQVSVETGPPPASSEEKMRGSGIWEGRRWEEGLQESRLALLCTASFSLTAATWECSLSSPLSPADLDGTGEE